MHTLMPPNYFFASYICKHLLSPSGSHSELAVHLLLGRCFSVYSLASLSGSRLEMQTAQAEVASWFQYLCALSTRSNPRIRLIHSGQGCCQFTSEDMSLCGQREQLVALWEGTRDKPGILLAFC